MYYCLWEVLLACYNQVQAMAHSMRHWAREKRVAKLKVALVGREWVGHRILALPPSVESSIEHCLHCHFLNILLVQLGLGILVLPWQEYHSKLDSMGTQKVDQGSMV
jgi:hypothetical protein